MSIKEPATSETLDHNSGTWLDRLWFSYLKTISVFQGFRKRVHICARVDWMYACVAHLPRLCRTLQQLSSPHQEIVFRFEKSHLWTWCDLYPLQSTGCGTQHRTVAPVTQSLAMKEWGQETGKVENKCSHQQNFDRLPCLYLPWMENVSSSQGGDGNFTGIAQTKTLSDAEFLLLSCFFPGIVLLMQLMEAPICAN